MPSDAICVLHTQIPREPRTEPNEPRFRKMLLGLVSVYWLLISVQSRGGNRVLGLGLGLGREVKNLIGIGLNPRTDTEHQAVSVHSQAWLGRTGRYSIE